MHLRVLLEDVTHDLHALAHLRLAAFGADAQAHRPRPWHAGRNEGVRQGQRDVAPTQLAQQAVLQLQTHGMAWEQGNAEAGEHRLALRLQRADLQGVGEVCTFLVAVLFAGATRA